MIIRSQLKCAQIIGKTPRHYSELLGTLGLSKSEKSQVFLLFLGIGIATTVGFFASGILGRNYLVLAGLGIVAYVFGLRHGVDADHISTIDNTTRKLMHDGKRPLTVGTWFSLGHSTIVVALIMALVISTRAVISSVPSLQNIGFLIGTDCFRNFPWQLDSILEAPFGRGFLPLILKQHLVTE